VTPGGITTVASSAGFKMTAQNAMDVVLINEDSFGTVRLAPYERWEALVADAKRNFDGFTKLVGRKKVVRMGVRFINRIDIPSADLSGRPLAEFIRVGLDIPSPLVRVWGGFSLATNLVEASTGTKIVLQAGEIAAALIDHFSFRLDIDAYSDAEIPGRIDEMWDRAELLRSAKNAVFESCITDASRKLFE